MIKEKAINTQISELELLEYEYQGAGKFTPEIDLDTYLYEAIKKMGPIERTELSKLTKVPRTTIFDHVIHLKSLGLISIQTVYSKKRGRPKVFYRKMEKTLENIENWEHEWED